MKNKKEEPYIGPFCPCCGAGAHGLEIIAELFAKVSKELNNDSTDVEDNLKEWASNIRDSHKTKLNKLQ